MDLKSALRHGRRDIQVDLLSGILFLALFFSNPKLDSLETTKPTTKPNQTTPTKQKQKKPS